MVSINNFGIALDMGVIPPTIKLAAKISTFGITKDYGVIPPKNYYPSKISVLGVSGDLAGDAIMTYVVI